MKAKYLIILLLLFVTCFTSCDKAPLTVGTIITESRPLPDFNKVYFYDDFNMVLVCSDTNYIEITTGENIMENITTEVIDKALIFHNNNTVSWIRPYDYERNVVLHYKDITYFTHASCGNVTCETQYNNDRINPNGHYRFKIEGSSGDVDLLINNCKDLLFQYQSGTSHINLHGSNNGTITIDKRSYGIFDARDYCADNVIITSKTPAHSYIWANDTIKAEILQHGNVYYKGNPSDIQVNYGPYSEGKLLPLSE